MNINLQIYKSLNILCVEDEDNIRLMYGEMFSIIFKNVYLAEDGEKGLAIFGKEQIDIVLTDYSMPVMDGLEMSEHIRRIDSSMPIIMITAIESIEMLRRAIDIQITSFIKKPILAETIFSTLEFVAKSVLADRFLIEFQKEKISYNQYQENLTYEKETTIIKNDVQDLLLDFKCEIFFKPRDILSGDSYSIRKLSKGSYLAFIVDGMGKGISASVTAMMCCAYINHTIDMLGEVKENLLQDIVEKLLIFIAPNLLEYEVVSISFFLFEEEKREIEYAMFSMPAVLYMKNDSEVVFKLKSNNPPLSAYTKQINTKVVSMKDISKMLIFSDGLNENSVKDSDDSYEEFLKDDFKLSHNLEKLEEKRLSCIAEQEDDITYLFLRK